MAALLVCGCGAGGATDDAAKGAGKLVGIGSDDAGKAFPKFQNQFDTGASALGDDVGRGGATAYERELYEQSVKTALCEGWAIYQDYGGWPTSDEWYEIIEDRMRAIQPELRTYLSAGVQPRRISLWRSATAI